MNDFLIFPLFFISLLLNCNFIFIWNREAFGGDENVEKFHYTSSYTLWKFNFSEYIVAYALTGCHNTWLEFVCWMWIKNYWKHFLVNVNMRFQGVEVHLTWNNLKKIFLIILNIIISINYPILDQKTSYSSKILSYHLFHFTYHKIFWELSFITHKHIKRTTTTSFTSH